MGVILEPEVGEETLYYHHGDAYKESVGDAELRLEIEPDAMISSICAGSFKAPMVATGLLTCFLISSARYTFTPCSANIDG